VKPRPFSYLAPGSTEEALSLLAEFAGEAAVLAGGQSLVPMLNLRIVSVGWLVDIMRIDSLRGIRVDNGWVEVGAAATQAEVAASTDVGARVPLLVEALRHVGHPSTRNAGTVAGSAAFADPVAEVPAVAAALDAELVLESRRGRRSVPAREFFVSVMSTVREPDELLAAVRFPVQAPGTGSAFLEISPRLGGSTGEFALVGVAAVLAVREGRIDRAALGYLGGGATPLRAAEAEALLAGEQPRDELFAEAADCAAASLEPSSDIHATADYRRRLAKVLTRRALATAVERAA
jgi:aerobic carbon-monoxide dehydrogenase medium subunit